MKAKRSVIVVGAGPAGLTAATELLKMGLKVTVLEEDPNYVGGLSRTFVHKDFRFDIGGHRFFSKNSEIVAWWNSRLPSDFLKVPRRSRIYYKGKFFDYPLTAGNALLNLGMWTSLHCVLSYFRAQIMPRTDEKTFEDWTVNNFGRRLYKIFFKTYTEKVWGIPCTEISADWARQRIKGLSLFKAFLNMVSVKMSRPLKVKSLIGEFSYPRLGPGMLWEKTRDDIVASGGSICMGKKVIRINYSRNRVYSVTTFSNESREETWTGDEFIVSMPLQSTICGMNPPPNISVLNAARMLRYRAFITVGLVVDCVNMFSDNWIYIHDPGVKVGRIQNYNNWSRDMVPRMGVTCLGMEYFCDAGDAMWSMSDSEMVALATSEIGRLKLTASGGIIDSCVIRMERAYPVYDSNYNNNVKQIKEFLEEFQNLQPIGRNGMHRYNNQDHSMMTGLLAARNLMTKKYDVWSVNTDAEYHECGSTSSSVVSE